MSGDKHIFIIHSSFHFCSCYFDLMGLHFLSEGLVQTKKTALHNKNIYINKLKKKDFKEESKRGGFRIKYIIGNNSK